MTDKRIQGYRDLKVYSRAFALQQDIFTLPKQFPGEELYALTDQIRRPQPMGEGNYILCPRNFRPSVRNIEAPQEYLLRGIYTL